MHSSTFQYLKPTDNQVAEMEICRSAAADFAKVVMEHMPDGPDKTYAMRKFREVAMWINIAITRNADGTPRT